LNALSKTAGKKTEFDMKYKFKVIHFAINYKPATDCLSPYNNAVVISKGSEEVAT